MGGGISLGYIFGRMFQLNSINDFLTSDLSECKRQIARTLFLDELIDSGMTAETSPTLSIIPTAAASEHGIVQPRNHYVSS